MAGYPWKLVGTTSYLSGNDNPLSGFQKRAEPGCINCMHFINAYWCECGGGSCCDVPAAGR
eukprot:scaffold47591_cov23-Tisochrysis_lutea.AAC.1